MKRVGLVLQLAVLLAFIWYSQFHRLGALVFRVWDETRLVTSAWEMTKTGNLLVPTVDFKPDMWSTKPPLMIWAQACCIKLHGLSEFSARFPSAASAALTTLAVFFFVFYLTKNGSTALLAGIILCTSHGFLETHGARYGEYDGMLTLFITLSIFTFFIYIERPYRQIWLLLFFLMLALGVLTKSIAAPLFTPALLIYLVFKGQLINTLRNKYLYAGLLLFGFLTVGYYLLREHYNPGFLTAVAGNELGGRFMANQHAQVQNHNYYLVNLIKEGRLHFWWVFLPFALALVPFQQQKLRRASGLLWLCVGIELFVISTAKTRLPWYDLPVYPMLAVIIALFIWQLVEAIGAINTSLNKKLLMPVIIVLLTWYPAKDVYNMIKYAWDDLERDSFYSVSYFLRDALTNGKNLNNTVCLSADYSYQWSIYVKRLADNGVGIVAEEFDGNNSFAPGKKVLVHQDATRNYLQTKYNLHQLESVRNIDLYEIEGKK